MKLYQPVLFVGLGGTGCDIGAEFERRLREEICGPDGHAFAPNAGKERCFPTSCHAAFSSSTRT